MARGKKISTTKAAGYTKHITPIAQTLIRTDRTKQTEQIDNKIV